MKHLRYRSDLLKITEGLCQCNSSRMMSLLNDIRTTWYSRLRLDCKQGAVIVPNVRSPVSVISYFSSVFFFYQLFINGLNIQARLKHSVTTLTFRYDINFPARLQHSGTTLIFPHDFNFSARLFHGMTFNFFSRKTQHNNQPGNDLLSRA